MLSIVRCILILEILKWEKMCILEWKEQNSNKSCDNNSYILLLTSRFHKYFTHASINKHFLSTHHVQALMQGIQGD